MAESSFKDFINELPEERRPLSEEEKREALEVANSIHSIAMSKVAADAKITGRKGFGNFAVANPDYKREITIWLNQEALKSSENPKAYMEIQIFDFAKDEFGKVLMPAVRGRLYLFSPDEIIANEKTFSGKMLDIKIEADLDTKKIIITETDPEQAKRVHDAEIHETYNPDKKELINLLSDLTMAKHESYMI